MQGHGQIRRDRHSRASVQRRSYCIWQGDGMWVQFPHIVIVIAASMKMWVSKHSGGERMRVHLLLLYTFFFATSQRAGAYTRLTESGKSMRKSSYPGIISVAGCHLAFSISLYKNRQVLSDSSFGNKTRNYSYPV